MNSFIPWIGGKRNLRKRIIELFPDVEERQRYVEVFGGAAWVMFGLCSGGGKPSPKEVYNDVNGELVNLFKMVKFHPEALKKELEYLVLSREIFMDCKEQMKIESLTEIQRAARFYTLLKQSYGANMKSFLMKNRDLERGMEYLDIISKRLRKVIIEHVSYDRLIPLYDRKDTLFYVDPPYFKTEFYYGDHFKEEDHRKLKDILSGIQGKFILSYNDCEEIRELYRDYPIIEEDRQHNLHKEDTSKRYKELIIKNF